MKPWVTLVMLGAVISFILGAMTAGDPGGWWLLAGALFSGLMWALIVWRSGHTPSSAWKDLRRPPRDHL